MRRLRRYFRPFKTPMMWLAVMFIGAAIVLTLKILEKIPIPTRKKEHRECVS